ncbi:MAG: adenylate kinase family protein [Methanomassiliicoccales archaeon]|nr:MAG: adenylate kinase family protein [Methanomassiliicoccales archaeon]
MMIALSGTPGVGKTTVSEILRDRGHNVLDLNLLAEENDFVSGYDEKRGSKEIDVKRLKEFVMEHFTEGDFFVEGHLSHFLSVDYAIVLRCDPLILKKRLSAKGWSSTKIMENIQAEILDVIKVEAFELLDKIYEVDTTSKVPEEAADDILGIISGKYEEPHINWLEKYEYLLFE